MIRAPLPYSLEKITYQEFDAGLRNLFQEMRGSSEIFSSPFFDLTFLDAVDSIRKNLGILLLKDEGDIRGILPFEHRSKTGACPPGSMMNDYHGLLIDASRALPGCWPQLRTLLKTAGIKRYRFHSAVNPELARYSFEQRICPYIDLGSGLENYLGWLQKHSNVLKKQRQKTRALVRKFGPLEFDFESHDRPAFDRALELKRDRFRRSNTYDIFSAGWTKDLLVELTAPPSVRTRTFLSVLRAGNELVAAHIGIRDDTTLHVWFPTYAPDYAKFSPGIELILQTITAAAADGIQTIDFGYDNQRFKLQFANEVRRTSLGLVASVPGTIGARCGHLVKSKLRQSSFSGKLRGLLRTFYPDFGSHRYR